MTRTAWWLSLGLGLAGCLPVGGGSGPDGGTGGPGGDQGVARDADTPDVPTAPPGAPRVLSLDSDTARLTEGEAFRITAVVTDDDGPEDVLGGVLEDPGGGAYGPFVATGVGTYQIELDWAALHRVAAIEFVGEPERVLWARFFDRGGLERVEALRLTLWCEGGGACAGRCQDVRTDPAHCGGCGVMCPAVGEAALCVDGRCTGACPEGQDLCGERCVDQARDPAHCGGCGVACPAVAGGEAVCEGGECGGRCVDGERACDGACVDVLANVAHCGGCGVVCPGGPGQQRCVDGDCLPACAGDEAVCEAECVDLAGDPANCGRCGRACEAPAGGAAECAGGECVDGCPAGRMACGGVCVDTDADPSHCGRCGNRCGAGLTCVAGDCTLVCPAGERACDGACARCPGQGATALACDGAACVATACGDGFELGGGACLTRVSEQVGRVDLLEPSVGAYPTIHLDLTTDGSGRPYLMLGRVAAAGDVVIEAGPRGPRGWQLEAINVFDDGRQAIRVGAVPLADGRMVHGWAYDRVDRSEVIGGGMQISGPGGAQIDRLPGNTGGNLWGFSVAALVFNGQTRAQMGISLDNPVNRSMSRYDWQGGDLGLVDPFIDGIVHFGLDLVGEPHFVYQPDYGGALSWRFGNQREAIGESAALLGGVRVGARGAVVSYAREPDTALRVATRSGGRWRAEAVDPGAAGGQFWGFDVELDGAGWPVACYWRNGAIYVARQSAAGWTRRRVAAVAGGQTECAVAVDAADAVSVAWAHFITQGGQTWATVHFDGLVP